MSITSKQDRGGVRTAQDLERKYDLAAIAGLKVAAKNSEVGLTKTNAELEQFIITTLGSMQEMQKQIDGSITTWFYSGVPDLTNAPANEWNSEESKNEHLGDLYYDKDTGYAYRFSQDEKGYYWFKIVDNDVVEALAVANAASDTADSKRRVFVEKPAPPYEVGDLWFNSQEIYICNLPKTKDQAFDENDFGKATIYTDDGRAEEIAVELKESMTEQYTSIIKTSEEIVLEALTAYTESGEFEEFKDTVSAQLQLMSDQMQLKFEQQSAVLNNVNNELQGQLNTIIKYFTFSVDGLIIGQVENPYKIIIDNDKFSMTVNDTEVMWIENGEVYTPEITIGKKIQALGYLIDVDASGNVNCEYIGGE